MGVMDFFRELFDNVFGDSDSAGDIFGMGQGDDSEDIPMLSNIGMSGDDIGDMSDLLEYIDEDLTGEVINSEFHDLQSALNYVDDAPKGILMIEISGDGEITVRRYDSK